MKEEVVKTSILVEIINPLDTIITHNDVLYKNKTLNDADICFLRIPPYREDKDYFYLVAEILKRAGVRIINDPDASKISGNKFHTSSLLASAGIPVLPSIAVRKASELDKAVESLGGYPLFMKTIFGTRGIGVIYCPCRETLRASAQTTWAYGANIFLEKFARGSEGETLRIFIFNEEILGAVTCRPANNEEDKDEKMRLLRSNFSRGGDLVQVEPPSQAAQRALEACRAVGLELAGVDMIQDDGEWKVLEINSSPGIKGLEKKTGENVAGKIVSRLLRF